MRRCATLAAFALLAFAARPASADTLRVIGAGSLAAAFTDLLRQFPAGEDNVAAPEFGASGLMRQKIEAGTQADLFASADMDQARRLAVGHAERTVVLFTRNRLCAIARTSVGLTPDDMLDKLLEPAVRLATSTPGADPGGDYAWAMFARADAVHPGARAALEAKAMKLVGRPQHAAARTRQRRVEGVFLADRADVMLGYCSGAPAVIRAVPNLVSVPLPPALTVGPPTAWWSSTRSPSPLRFALFVVSERPPKHATRPRLRPRGAGRPRAAALNASKDTRHEDQRPQPAERPHRHRHPRRDHQPRHHRHRRRHRHLVDHQRGGSTS